MKEPASDKMWYKATLSLLICYICLATAAPAAPPQTKPLPPDPCTISMGRGFFRRPQIIFSSYTVVDSSADMTLLLLHASEVAGEHASFHPLQPVGDPINNQLGQATFTLNPSPYLTWKEWEDFLDFGIRIFRVNYFNRINFAYELRDNRRRTIGTGTAISGRRNDNGTLTSGSQLIGNTSQADKTTLADLFYSTANPTVKSTVYSTAKPPVNSTVSLTVRSTVNSAVNSLPPTDPFRMSTDFGFNVTFSSFALSTRPVKTGAVLILAAPMAYQHVPGDRAVAVAIPVTTLL